MDGEGDRVDGVWRLVEDGEEGAKGLGGVDRTEGRGDDGEMTDATGSAFGIPWRCLMEKIGESGEGDGLGKRMGSVREGRN